MTKSVLWNLAKIRVLSLLKNKDLDSSYKMDLDFWYSFGTKHSVLEPKKKKFFPFGEKSALISKWMRRFVFGYYGQYPRILRQLPSIIDGQVP